MRGFQVKLSDYLCTPTSLSQPDRLSRPALRSVGAEPRGDGRARLGPGHPRTHRAEPGRPCPPAGPATPPPGGSPGPPSPSAPSQRWLPKARDTGPSAPHEHLRPRGRPLTASPPNQELMPNPQPAPQPALPARPAQAPGAARLRHELRSRPPREQPLRPHPSLPPGAIPPVTSLPGRPFWAVRAGRCGGAGSARAAGL